MTELDRLRDFGERYTAAWCSRIPASVAEFYEKGGSLGVNGAPSAAGRAAISAIAAGFMSAFPDMRLRVDEVVLREGAAVYRSTFFGTNSGPGGGGRRVCFSGFEEWTFGGDGLIAESKGHFGEENYQRQLKEGFE